MTERLLGNLRPSAKVTIPTRPWLAARGRDDNGGQQPKVRHAPSIIVAEGQMMVAYCSTWQEVRDERPDLPLCRKCVQRLTGHGLWPL